MWWIVGLGVAAAGRLDVPDKGSSVVVGYDDRQDLELQGLGAATEWVAVGDCRRSVDHDGGVDHVTLTGCPFLLGKTLDAELLVFEQAEREARVVKLVDPPFNPREVTVTLPQVDPSRGLSLPLVEGEAQLEDPVTPAAGAATAWVYVGAHGWRPAAYDAARDRVVIDRATLAALPVGKWDLRVSRRGLVTAYTITTTARGATPADVQTVCSTALDEAHAHWQATVHVRSGEVANRVERRTRPYVLCGTYGEKTGFSWQLHGPPSRGREWERTDLWLRPNRALHVTVVGPSTLRIVSQNPITSGAQDDVIDGPSPTAGPAGADRGTVARSASLAPRAPGPFVVELQAPTKKDATTVEYKTVASAELVVLRPYFGAVRFGFGTSFTPEDRDWTIREDQGRNVLVLAGPWAPMPEFVVGFTPYLRPGGRSFVPNRLQFTGAPYLGVGVLNPTNSLGGGLPVSFLRTLYLGGELGLGRFFGVAVAGTVRTERVPVAWAGEGAPVGTSDLTEVTRVAPLPGIGLVLDVGPPLFSAVTSNLPLGAR